MIVMRFSSDIQSKSLSYLSALSIGGGFLDCFKDFSDASEMIWSHIFYFKALLFYTSRFLS